jgi:2-(1,2-epoxy-1,2-dihydrophenyl)acetyl-CoA isomerase
MTEPAPAPVLLETRAGVARLTLNRPGAANAIDLDLARALAAATHRVRTDPTVRVVLLAGAGSRFCAGGDVRGFAGVGGQLGDHLGELLGALHPAIADLAALEVPLVAAVQGSAAGAGISLFAAADLVVAAENTRFVLAYTSLGLVPDGGSTWSLPRAVGLRRALELVLTNRTLDAAEALAWGLVTRVVPDDELTAEADRLVTELAEGPPAALAAAKRLVRDGLGASLDEQLRREAAAMVLAGNSADGQEGVAAFVEKRRARFSPPT